MGTNSDVEDRAIADDIVTDDAAVNESTPPNGSAEEKESEPSFDTGFKPWLQVFASFFCFFNSWYAVILPSWRFPPKY